MLALLKQAPSRLIKALLALVVSLLACALVWALWTPTVASYLVQLSHGTLVYLADGALVVALAAAVARGARAEITFSPAWDALRGWSTAWLGRFGGGSTEDNGGVFTQPSMDLDPSTATDSEDFLVFLADVFEFMYQETAHLVASYSELRAVVLLGGLGLVGARAYRHVQSRRKFKR